MFVGGMKVTTVVLCWQSAAEGSCHPATEEDKVCGLARRAFQELPRDRVEISSECGPM